ncbi:MAG: acyltransferase family protein [Bacteroidota bacterium]
MTSAPLRPARRHDLDWLRVICITLLLYYHVGMIFVSWGFHIQSTETSALLEHIMLWMHRWRMPLLFFISGAGTRFALRKRSAGQYLGERWLRLQVPVPFGMFVIVPPQIYIERIDQFTSFADFYPSVLDLVPYPEGSFSWHHLWFVMYLFCYSVLALPVFLWLRSERAAAFRDRLAGWMARPGRAMLLALPVLAAELALRPHFPENTHALIGDWANFAFNLFFFVLGFVVCLDIRLWDTLKTQRRAHLGAALLTTAALYVVYDFVPSVTRTDVGWIAPTVLTSFFWVLALVGYGQVYLAKSHPMLRHLNEGVYPFYILHQTVILAVGYGVLQWGIGVWAGFAVISTASLLLTAGLYLVFVRPFDPVRVLFGMRPKSVRRNSTPAEPRPV